MTGEEATAATMRALNGAEIPYMLVGSLSSNFYGIPRATLDADFVVQLNERSITALSQSLPAGMRLDPQLAFETVTGTICNKIGVSNSEFIIEVFRLGNDPHDLERFQRRRKAVVLGVEAWLPSVEDVVITKLRWSQLGARQKDVDDVRNVIAVQRQVIDWKYVERWCRKHGTIELLESVRRSLPSL